MCFLIFWSILVVNSSSSYLLYYFESILIDEGWYAKHAILKAVNVVAGYPLQEKHFPSKAITEFFSFWLISSEFDYLVPKREIFCLSI
jgi:hypothetical protein